MIAVARLRPSWCSNPAEIARLLRWLRADAGGLDLADAIGIVETPWDWDHEYQQMCAEQNAPASAAEVVGEDRGNR